jgi:hypothetical protein
MQALQQSYRGISLVMLLNRDRMLFLATIAAALVAAAYLGSP